jgi:uncharacterized protein YjbI with pentapeptide repeats
MRLSALGIIIVGVLLSLCAVFCITVAQTDSASQIDTTWTWWDRYEVAHTRAELDSIIAENDSDRVDIVAALMESGDTTVLREGTYLEGADLSGAELALGDFAHANWGATNLSHANLYYTDLSYATIWGTNLSYASLRGTNLAGANLTNCNMSGVIFDPDSLPDIDGIASAIGLATMTYEVSPSKLVALREAFAAAGYRQQERQIICALRRHDQNPIERVAFDWTSEWGSNLSRPWWLFGVVFALSAAVYYAFVWKRRHSGICLIFSKTPGHRTATRGDDWQDVDENHTSVYFYAGSPAMKLTGTSWYSRLPAKVRLIWWALFFSAISAFNIGFRDVNFGRWLRLLTRTDYDLKPFGWVRVISGFQALLSVYLIALWILSWAGTPFK